MPGIELQVVFLASTEPTRSWRGLLENAGFDFKILNRPWFWPAFLSRRYKWNSGVWSAIRRYSPDVVLTSGYSEIAYWQVGLYSRLSKPAWVNWNGTTLHTERRRGPLIRKLRELFVRSADASVSYGSLATQFLTERGVDPSSVVTGVNTTDVEAIASAVSRIRAADDFDAQRNAYPAFLISVVGRLLRFKGIDDILLALRELDSEDIGLLVVGDGPDQPRLESLVAEYGVSNVYFDGFTKYEDLTTQLALSDISIFASYDDVWGMVVNESLAAGVYTLCSTGAGVHADLINSEVNGDVFAPGDFHELANLIKAAFVRRDHLRNIRSDISVESLKITRPEIHIDALVKSVNLAVDNRTK